MEGFNTNNDVPYPPNGHSGNIISIKDVIKSNLVESLIPNKQRLSVQFPVRECLVVVAVPLPAQTCLLICGYFQASVPHYTPPPRKLSSQNPFIEPAASKPVTVDIKGKIIDIAVLFLLPAVSGNACILLCLFIASFIPPEIFGLET